MQSAIQSGNAIYNNILAKSEFLEKTDTICDLNDLNNGIKTKVYLFK